MSIRIQLPPATAALARSESSPEAKAKEDTAKVGREFEAIFVRQMLSSAKIAGKGGGYADMAVESLATSITAGGGLGMGRAIEQALSAHTAALHPETTSATTTTDITKSTEPAQVSPRPTVRRIGP
jgi:Rod binding domain-containing protein